MVSRPGCRLPRSPHVPSGPMQVAAPVSQLLLAPFRLRSLHLFFPFLECHPPDPFCLRLQISSFSENVSQTTETRSRGFYGPVSPVLSSAAGPSSWAVMACVSASLYIPISLRVDTTCLSLCIPRPEGDTSVPSK